jgi:hypothetical protein
MRLVLRTITYVIICCIIYSCGTTTKTVSPELEGYLALNRQIRENIKKQGKLLSTKAFEEGNIDALIDILNHPISSGLAEQYIYDYDYSYSSYKDIKRYAAKVKSHVDASIFFDSLLVSRQAATLDSLSKMSLVEIGDFYRTNGEEHDYLKNILEATYLSDIPSLDYNSRKTLFTIFKETDLAPKIEQAYLELRDSLLTEITATLTAYFDSEKDIMNKIEEAVRFESQKYVEDGVIKIITAINTKNERGAFKKIFKREDIDNYSYTEFIDKIIHETYDASYIEKLVKDRIIEFVTASNELRSTLFNQYFSDNEYSNLNISLNPIRNSLYWYIGGDEFNEIQKVKNVGTILSVGSLALGLIPGVGTGVAAVADIADISYGMSKDNRINHAMENIGSRIYQDSSNSIDYFLTKVFDELKESQQRSEDLFIRIFNEEF